LKSSGAAAKERREMAHLPALCALCVPLRSLLKSAPF
jgi:hypothetical protein